MKISQDTWHFKVFDWWHREKHGFSFKDYHGSSARYNLCPYVRAILFWAPSRLFWTPPALYGTIPVSLSAFLLAVYKLWGNRGLLGLWHFFLLLLGCTTLVALIGAVGFACHYIKEYFEHNRKSTLVSFVSVLAARAEATHGRICPILSFETDEVAE